MKIFLTNILYCSNNSNVVFYDVLYIIKEKFVTWRLWNMDERFYLYYASTGSLSNSGELCDIVKSLLRYRMKHPDQIVSIMDDDGYIIPSYVINPIVNNILSQ